VGADGNIVAVVKAGELVGASMGAVGYLVQFVKKDVAIGCG
jgi:hypothetical protein